MGAFGLLLCAGLLTVQTPSESLDRELWIRVRALESAGAIGAPQAQEERRLEAESLGRRARVRGTLSAEELRFIRALLIDADGTLREWAMRALVESGSALSKGAPNGIAQELARDPLPAVRIELAKHLALHSAHDSAARELLFRLCDDRQPEVARAARYALLHSALSAGGSDEEELRSWHDAAATVMASLLQSEQPLAFLEAVDFVATSRPAAEGLWTAVAERLAGFPEALGARSLVEAARAASSGRSGVDAPLLLDGFLRPLPGDLDRDRPRAAHRRLQRSALRALGPAFALTLIRHSLESPGFASPEQQLYVLEGGLLAASFESVADLGVRAVGVEAEAEEWWETFFDALRGKTVKLDTPVLEVLLAEQRTRDLRWAALRALLASFRADRPGVRERFEALLHGNDRELAEDLFGLVARAQRDLAGKQPRNWREIDEILFGAWRRDERLSDFDWLSREGPHQAFAPSLLALCLRSADSRTASVLELCSGLVEERTRLEAFREGTASGALLRALELDRKLLAEEGGDLRDREARVRHELRALFDAQVYGWREALLETLEVADRVGSEDVAKTAAALLARGGEQGLRALAENLSRIEGSRGRLEILLALTPAAATLGLPVSASAAGELRSRFVRCDAELRLRAVKALGRFVQAESLPAVELTRTAEFLERTALDGSLASQVRTAAVESLARACEVSGSGKRLRGLAEALARTVTDLGGASEGAMEARLVALGALAELAQSAPSIDEALTNRDFLRSALDDVVAVLGAESSEADLVRAELERERLLPVLAQAPEGAEARLAAEWSRQLAGEAALEVLADRLEGVKLTRREFLLRAELAGLAEATEASATEALLVPELDARSALLAVRVLTGQAELRRALLERAILGFSGEAQTEERARFELEARLRSLLLRLEAGEAGGAALAASLRFDLASPERSAERALEVVFFSAESEVPIAERGLSVRTRALSLFDNLTRTAAGRASAEDR